MLMILLLPVASASAPTAIQPVPVVNQLDPAIQLKIEKLIQCESGNKNVTIVDTNGLTSHGILQFQKATFTTYMIRYGIAPHAERQELENFLNDSETQRELAYRMLEEDPKNARHWYNCAVISGII